MARMFHDQPFDQILKSYTPYASLDTYGKSMQDKKPQVPKWCLEGPSRHWFWS